MISASVFLCPTKAKGLGLSAVAIKLQQAPIISLKDKGLNPSGGYGNILHLYLESPLVPRRLFFQIKMRTEDGGLPRRLLGSIKQGFLAHRARRCFA